MKQKLLYAFIILLLVVNSVLIYMVIKKPHEKRNQPNRTFLTTTLGFSSEQNEAFRTLDEKHKDKMRQFDKQIRRNKDIKETPVIMLTARSEEDDKIRGLDVGADDFVTKPYSVVELLSRVKAALRRPRASIISDTIVSGILTISTIEHKVFVDKIEVVLGPTEFRLLMTFMKQPGRVYSRDQLLDMVWGISADIDTRTVDVHVGRLRKVIDSKSGKKLIRTVRGFGYALQNL